MTRVLTLYQGADLDPDWDYSDWVEWPDCEFGTRCNNGEATQGELRVRDLFGETGNNGNLPGGLTYRGISAHNVMTLTEDASGAEKHIWRGWVIPKDYSRGTQKADRAREIRVAVEDNNAELRGIIVGRDGAESRPVETDVARVLWLLDTYFDGARRAATVIGDAYVPNTNTVSMPAKDYENVTPEEVLRDCATSADKRFWVILNDDGTLELFYDIITSTAYASSLQIRQTGTPTEVDGTTTFEPIWDVGPASREDGQGLLSGVKVVGAGEVSAYVSHAGTEDDYNHYEEVIYDEFATTNAEALVKANVILGVRRFEERTYSCSLLIPADRIHLIKAGMNITIQAKVIPDADDQVVTRRIGQLKFRVYNADTYKVALQLDRPARVAPRNRGLKPGPVSASGGTPSVIHADGNVSGTVGDIGTADYTADGSPSEALYAFLSTPNIFPVLTVKWVRGGVLPDQNYTVLDTVTNGGTRVEVWRLLNPGSGAGQTVASNGTGSVPMGVLLVRGRTPGSTDVTANNTGSSSASSLTISGGLVMDAASHHSTGGGGAPGSAPPTPGGGQTTAWALNFQADDLEYGGSYGANNPTWTFTGSMTWASIGVALAGTGIGSVGGSGSASPGSPGTYLPGGSTLEHQNITTGGPYHMAEDVTFAPHGSIAATNVQAAIQEVRDEAAGTFVGARVNHGSNQTLTTNVQTSLAMDSERFDTSGFHDTSTNNSRLTVPSGLDGVYMIGGSARFPSSGAATGFRTIAILLNGTTVIAYQRTHPNNTTDSSLLAISTLYELAVGDYVELQGWQTSGGNLDVTTNTNYSPEFWITKQ